MAVVEVPQTPLEAMALAVVAVGRIALIPEEPEPFIIMAAMVLLLPVAAAVAQVPPVQTQHWILARMAGRGLTILPISAQALVNLVGLAAAALVPIALLAAQEGQAAVVMLK